MLSQKAHSCDGHNIVYIHSHRNSQTSETRSTQIHVFFTLNFFQLNASLAGKGDRGKAKTEEDGNKEKEQWMEMKKTYKSLLFQSHVAWEDFCLDTAVVFFLLLPSESQAAIIRNTRGHMMPRGANVFCFPNVLNGVTHITRLTSKC